MLHLTSYSRWLRDSNLAFPKFEITSATEVPGHVGAVCIVHSDRTTAVSLYSRSHVRDMR